MDGDAILPATLRNTARAPIRLVEIELAEPIEAIEAWRVGERPTPASIVALVRLHGEPLGTVAIPADTGVATPERCIAAIHAALGDRIAAHLTRDRIEWNGTIPPGGFNTLSGSPRCLTERQEVLTRAPLVSVVVATHDRPESIRRCLQSLVQLDYPRFEIVVVVNAPPPDVSFDYVAAEFAADSRVRWLSEEVQGACRARNRGVREARGSIIAFCDDDVIHDRNWLTELVQGFSMGRDVACVTGLAYPSEIATDSQLWFEQYGGFGAGFTPKLFDLGEHRPNDPLYPFRPAIFGVGTNMAWKATAFGGFDAALGPGSPPTSGEDYAIYFQTILDGHQIAYRPSAIVYHRHRRDYASLRKQIYGYAAGYSAALIHTVLRHPAAFWLLARNLPRGIAGFATAKEAYTDQAGFPMDISKLEVAGLIAGPALYLLGRVRARRSGRRRPLDARAAGLAINSLNKEGTARPSRVHS